MEAPRLCILVCIVALNYRTVVSIVHGRILDDDQNIGVGSAEEVPISSLTFKFAEPDVQVQRALVQPWAPQAPAPVRRLTPSVAHAQAMPEAGELEDAAAAAAAQQDEEEDEEEEQDEEYEIEEVQDIREGHLQLHQDQQDVVYDAIEDDEYSREEINLNGAIGEGSIESIPIESMRVRFDPLTLFGHPKETGKEGPRDVAVEEEEQEEPLQPECEPRCVLPPMPVAMLEATQRCSVELVYQQAPLPPKQENVTREGRALEANSPRRLDTSLRTACGSKCVLGELKLLREGGVPDADRVTGLLLQSAGHAWMPALRHANQACSQLLDTATAQAPGYRAKLTEKQKCQFASGFMKCVRAEIIKHCPKEHTVVEDCHRKKPDQEIEIQQKIK